MTKKYSFISFIHQSGKVPKDPSFSGLLKSCIKLGMQVDEKHLSKSSKEIYEDPDLLVSIMMYHSQHCPPADLSALDFSLFDMTNPEVKDNCLFELMHNVNFFNQLSQKDVDYILSIANLSCKGRSNSPEFIVDLCRINHGMNFTDSQLHYIINHSEVNTIRYNNKPLLNYILQNTDKIVFKEEHILKIIALHKANNLLNLEPINVADSYSLLDCLHPNATPQVPETIKKAVIDCIFFDTSQSVQFESIIEAIFNNTPILHPFDSPNYFAELIAQIYKHTIDKDWFYTCFSNWAKANDKPQFLNLDCFTSLIEKRILDTNLSICNPAKEETHKI